MPRVLSSVDTKLISKPEVLSGQDTEWPRSSLTKRAYLGAASRRRLEPLRRAKFVEKSRDRVDLDLGDDVLDAQLYFS